ncbi:hypothetical protein [Streptomyces yanii]|uniref:Uncharacterized protein n=1 Tax=Streptomyces yanii TaxID=78510 RepID=A0ABV5R9U9_9ACTN
MDTALGSLRKRATAVNLAVWEQPAQIAPTPLMLSETALASTIGYAGSDFPAPAFRPGKQSLAT